MEIVRFSVFDKGYRFKPFTVREYRDLLLIRAELEEDETALDDLLEYLFKDIQNEYRWIAFMKRYVATIGKDKLKMRYKCAKCEKDNMLIFDIKTDNINYIEYKVPKTNINLRIKPSILSDQDPRSFLDNIHEVETEEVFKWDSLSDGDKEQIYNAVDLVDISKMQEQSILKYSYKNRCCINKEVHIYSFIDLFKILFTTDEIFEFYKSNRVLNTKGYSNNDLMDMLYVERTIALSLILNEERNNAK